MDWVIGFFFGGFVGAVLGLAWEGEFTLRFTVDPKPTPPPPNDAMKEGLA